MPNSPSFSQPSSILSPQNDLFRRFKSPFSQPLLFTPSVFISGLFFFSFISSAELPHPPPLLPPPFILCTKLLSDASFTLPLLCTSPWKAQRSGLTLPVGERGTARGCQYTNTKQYPIVHPPLCFLQWEASSTKDIKWFWGPEWSFDKSRNKNWLM